MKIRLTFKTPDVLDQVDKQVEGKLEYPGNINDIRASLSKWIEFSWPNSDVVPIIYAK